MSELERPEEPETWIPLMMGMGACAALSFYLSIFQLDLILHMTFWGVEGWPGLLLGLFARSGVMAIIAWAVVWFGFVAKTGRQVMDRYFLLLLATSLVAGGLSMGVGWVVLQVRTYAPVTATQNEPAQFQLQRGLLAGEAADFERDLKTTLGATVLDPTALAADPGLRGVKARLARAHALVAERKAAQDRRLAAWRAGLAAPEAANLTDDLAPTMEKTALFWSGHEARLSRMDDLAELLARTRGAWTVHGRRVDFTRQADLNAFRQRLAAVDETTTLLQRARLVVLNPAGGAIVAPAARGARTAP